MLLVFLSLLSAIIFGLVDAGLFLSAEELLQKQFNKIWFFNNSMSELLTGGVSAAVAILVASTIKYLLHKKYKIVENPLFEFSGILIGTFLVLAIYYAVNAKKIKKEREQVTITETISYV